MSDGGECGGEEIWKRNGLVEEARREKREGMQGLKTEEGEELGNS